MIVGLDQPDGGRVTIGGQRYGALRWPLREVARCLPALAAGAWALARRDA